MLIRTTQMQHLTRQVENIYLGKCYYAFEKYKLVAKHSLTYLVVYLAAQRVNDKRIDTAIDHHWVSQFVPLTVS